MSLEPQHRFASCYASLKTLIDPVLAKHRDFVQDEPMPYENGLEIRFEITGEHHSRVVLGETFSDNIYADMRQALENHGFVVSREETEPDGSFILRIDCRGAAEA